jgi:regulator of protease activity HflC (stomatin/prohibitin superfamily)
MAQTKSIKKIIPLIILLLVAVWISTTVKRYTIAPDQTGVLTLFGKHSVYQPGETAIVWPAISNLVILTSKPILFVLAGQGAVLLAGADGKEISVSCQLRYQVTDPVQLIAAQGVNDPVTGIDQQIRQKVNELIKENYQKDPSLFDELPSRIMLVAETTHQLNQLLERQGVTVLSFELLDW